MIGGIDPIIILHIFNKPERSIYGPLNEFDQRLDDLIGLVGIPIPIPLNERLTGIYIQNESRSINVTTNIDPSTEKDEVTGETKAATVTQTSTGSDVSINLVADKDSILLVALLAFIDVIMNKLASAEYGITYFNGPIVIFNGLLSNFRVHSDPNTTKLDIEFGISTAKKEQPKLPDATPKGPLPVPRIDGTALGPTGVAA